MSREPYPPHGSDSFRSGDVLVFVDRRDGSSWPARVFLLGYATGSAPLVYSFLTARERIERVVVRALIAFYADPVPGRSILLPSYRDGDAGFDALRYPVDAQEERQVDDFARETARAYERWANERALRAASVARHRLV